MTNFQFTIFNFQSILKLINWKLFENLKLEIGNSGMKNHIKILILTILLGTTLLANSASAAVPTFDVGLNPKMDTLLNQMDLLLCMIAGIHQKEVGPPPVSTCSTAGLGGNGGPGSTSGGGLSGLLGGLGGNLLSGVIGSIGGQLSSVFGNLGNIFPSSLFNFLPGPGGTPSINSIPSIGSVIGGVAGIFGGCDSLDCIAWNISKALLASFSKQVTDWVRTGGVNGDSLFVRDWERFLADAADQASGLFFEELNQMDICKPFATEVKLTIANKFNNSRQPFHQRARCTVSSVMSNFENFYDDFGNGGWLRWLEITQIPQNNIHGFTFLAAEEQLYRETLAAETARDEALASDGFIGQKVCVPKTIEIPPDDDDEGGAVEYEDCQIVTPGDLVEEEMTEVLGAEVEQLNMADELDEVLSVLLNQLLQGVLFSAGGLFSPTYTPTPTSPSPIPPPSPTPPTPPAPPAPPGTPLPITVDIKANGFDGPITISSNTSANLSWISTNAQSCSVSPIGLTGTSNSGVSTGNLTASQNYTLTCTASNVITVTSATYAANCGAPTPVNSVATQCNGQKSCAYTMNYLADPGFDPAGSCPKDLTVKYICPADGAKQVYVPGEATGKTVNLSCPSPDPSASDSVLVNVTP